MENSAKILLLGKTGVGKSSFINYFLGRKVAEAAAGKPVTPEYFIPYEIEDGRYPIEIFDTKGLEALGAHKQLNEIINGIKERNNSGDIFDWFHTIFYCVSMTTHFEDFEAEFVRELRQELAQHIHIILTHCDSVAPESIVNMRRRIADALGDMGGVEIFEVVCVSKKKRNGMVVEPSGKEKISERVFELLLEDIAHRLSSDYAGTLRPAMINAIDRTFTDLDNFIDEQVKLRTLFQLIKDIDGTSDRIVERMDEVGDQIEESIDRIQKQTNERFAEILRPAAQLYASYWGIATNSYVEHAGLEFYDVFDWMDVDWADELDDSAMIAKVLPRLGRYMDEDGDFSDDGSASEIIGMILAGAGDLINLKKNLKGFTQELRWQMYQSIPSLEEIQATAYDRIVQYMKSGITSRV